MKTIELVTLHCERFKGFVEKDFDFGGRNSCIYGANGTGKSTINDAFFWLLFGKNAAGETDFEIKPRGRDGKLLFPGAETIVSAEMKIDGAPIHLKRVLKEVWTTRRGSVEKVFSGNTTDYYVDDFPVKKGEYEKKISDIATENVFRLISSTTNFFKLHPKEQREILFGLTNTFSDIELAIGHPDYLELCEDLAGHSVEELRKKLALERKNLSEKRNLIPARLDELFKIKGSLSSIDFSKSREALEKEIERREILCGQKNDLLVALNVGEWELKLNECRSEMKMLDKENQLHKNSQIQSEKYTHEKRVFEDRIHFLEDNLSRSEKGIRTKNEEISFLEKQLQALREEYATEDKKKPVFGKECPTCKRPYEEAALRAAETKMLSEKKLRLEEICKKASELSERIEKHKEELSSLQEEKEKIEKDLLEVIKSLENAIQKEKEENAKPCGDLPGYAPKMEGLKAQEKVILETIQSKTKEKESLVSVIDQEISEINKEILSAQAEIAKEESLLDTKKRIEELEEAAKKYAARIEEIDQKIFLCESFTKYKVSTIESGINEKFSITTFSLFKEQINGGIADTCEAMKEGVPYSDLNNGSKVNVGIDVVNSLSKHYGVSVPLFVDNAEGVTDMMDPLGQSIRLYVSASDKEMRCVEE